MDSPTSGSFYPLFVWFVRYGLWIDGKYVRKNELLIKVSIHPNYKNLPLVASKNEMVWKFNIAIIVTNTIMVISIIAVLLKRTDSHTEIISFILKTTNKTRTTD